jgi:uncharacterized protein YndB with AHSA1/START domain
VRKIIRAKPERVFDAWIKPELMEQWFRKKNWSAKMTNDVRVGGSYSHEMTPEAGASDCASETSSSSGAHQCRLHQGEYLEIRRPEKLVFTWNTPEVRDTRVTVDLRDLGDSTEVIITHELLATDDLRKAHAQGWEMCLENLSNFLG